jgi:Lon protease-like protein
VLDPLEELRGFPRVIPVFPLSGVVLFPGALLPLHIFEPRYREMVRDVVAGDGLVSLGLLLPCGSAEYEQKPPFHPTVCVGKVVHHESLDADRFNIALLGLSAAHAVAADGARPYRVAELELLADRADYTTRHLTQLDTVLKGSLPGGTSLDALKEQMKAIVPGDQIGAAMVNTCALAAPVLPAQKLELLEERSLARRAERLIELLERPWQWN